MSQAAGTLITTHNATFIPPRFMPGYKGHIPTMQFDYGETYGNATAKYFQDYRCDTLAASSSNYARGGYFPSFYTHAPDMVISARTRGQDRWMAAPRYSLSNVDHDRKEELVRFDKAAQAHRDHYNDKSGTVHRVDHFVLPKQQTHEPLTASLVKTSCSNGDQSEPGRRQPVRRSFQPVSSQRDRAMRDVYFELR